jgi:hypothetical protein
MQKNRRRGRVAIGAFSLQKHAEKQAQTRTYLEPNRNSMQKPIEGLSAAFLPELYKATINKGAIVCAQR